MNRSLLTNMIFGTLLFLSATFAERAQAGQRDTPLQTVAAVELPAYLGTWYEVARIPNWFQTGCFNTTANYGLNKNGTISVLNRCQVVDEHSGETTTKEAFGRAWIENPETKAELKVSFFKFIGWWKIFGGDYWILELGPKNAEGLYSYAVVGEPSCDYGWVLSRTPQLSEETLAGIFQRLADQGYDTSRFELSKQTIR